MGGQLLRSGTSPLPNHGEAQAAESLSDFIHKLKLCLKELNETHRWLRLVHRVPLIDKPVKVEPLLQETDELCRIFNKSIATSRARLQNEESGRLKEDISQPEEDADPWLLAPWTLRVKSSELRVQPPAGPVKYPRKRR